jgi:hypothetical protein
METDARTEGKGPEENPLEQQVEKAQTAAGGLPVAPSMGPTHLRHAWWANRGEPCIRPLCLS